LTANESADVLTEDKDCLEVDLTDDSWVEIDFFFFFVSVTTRLAEDESAYFEDDLTDVLSTNWDCLEVDWTDDSLVEVVFFFFASVPDVE
jgi:hypothetical protein